MTLGDYLLEVGSKPRVAGAHDCATLPAGWAIVCGHPDPMAKWRGYTSEAEAEELIAAAGGLVALFNEGLVEAGCPVVTDPRAGDIGVVSMFGEEAGSIFTGRRWAFVADRGLTFATIGPEHISRVWRP